MDGARHKDIIGPLNPIITFIMKTRNCTIKISPNQPVVLLHLRLDFAALCIGLAHAPCSIVEA